MSKPQHSYQLFDKVWHHTDTCPFFVVGLRADQVEIRDSSGEDDWVPANEVEAWQPAFLGVPRSLHDPTPGSCPNEFRYVAAGWPTLREDFERWLEFRLGDWGERLITQVLGRKPKTVLQMLRHERSMEAWPFLHLCDLLGLSFDEATARLWANAPAEKIAEHQRVRDNIAQMHTLAEARKILQGSTTSPST